MNARPRATEPFFVVPKASLTAIVERVEGTSVSFCVSVFCALRWLANDAPGNAPRIEATVALIAYRAGVGYNTAAKALAALESIGVIVVDRRAIPGTKGRAPSLYSFPSIVGTSRVTRGTLPTSWGTLPTATGAPHAERIKEQEEQKELNQAGPAGPGERVETFPLSQTPQIAKKPTRPEVACFMALARAEGADPAQLTASGAKSIAVALASIRSVCPSVTPEEIERRSRVYLRVMPAGTRLTAHALAKHWARCDGTRDLVKRAVTSGEEEPFDWREMVNDDCPDCVYARGGAHEGTPWASLDDSTRRWIIGAMASWRKRTGRAVA